MTGKEWNSLEPTSDDIIRSSYNTPTPNAESPNNPPFPKKWITIIVK